ncbi:unnamed protein product [Rotaria magnacalcarata]|uniref:Uncharacterized protein n=1 Tax=Rotaria magnacalcarata TaxID=392030 RepID=A0A816WBV2_9BILA|nr:unnamed protein product [Rotaria magnacalcarata]
MSTSYHHLRDLSTTETTEAELNNDSSKENRRKKARTDTSTDRLSQKRRCRQSKGYKNNNNNNVEWSFSSGEDYQPPLLEQLYPSSHSSHTDITEFYFITRGRLDYFCEKYLCVTGVTAIREFQHAAQLQLLVHKENLYELLRFIRRTPNYFTSIQEIGRKYKDEGVEVQIKELVNHLIDIRKTSNFVNITFVVN